MATVEVPHVINAQLVVSGSITALDNTVTLNRFLTWGVVGVQITGTFVGTLSFEGTIDGATFVSQVVSPSTGGAAVSTATAPGIWANTNNSLAAIRVHATAWTSGTAVVTIKSLPSQY